MVVEVESSPDLKLNPLKDNAGKILKEATDRISHPYWLSAGTALGMYRDEDFIKGDTDIDIAMIGYEGIDKDIIDALEGYKIVRTAFYDGNPMQIAFMTEDTVFDVYFHWPEGDNMVNYNTSGKTVMRADIYKNIKFFNTKHGLYPFPSPIEEYLEIRYGDDWRTPKNSKPSFEEI